MISGIHHVALRTRDVRRLLDFYATLLELSPSAGGDGVLRVWLSAGETRVMIERAEEGEPPIPKGSMELIAFAIQPKMRASYTERLRTLGVAIEGETQFTVYLRDPDGRRVALSHHPHPAA